jgi:hypothetical protein
MKRCYFKKKKVKGSPAKKKPSEKSKLEEKFLELFLKYFPNLPKPVTQLVFHKHRKWRFDFAWPDVKVAVEIQGGAFMRRTYYGNRTSKGLRKT